MLPYARDPEERSPLVVRKSAAETDGEFVRFELTLYPRRPSFDLNSVLDDDVSLDPMGELRRDAVLDHRPWSIDFPTEHVHPLQEEHWNVISGALAVDCDGTEALLAEGEAIELPKGVPHRLWNPIDEPSRVGLEFHPALDAQPLTETLYVLAQKGDTSETGDLKLLQFAATLDAAPNQLYLTSVPVSVQKLLIAMLAPIGRRVGYHAIHSLDSPETID